MQKQRHSDKGDSIKDRAVALVVDDGVANNVTVVEKRQLGSWCQYVPFPKTIHSVWRGQNKDKRTSSRLCQNRTMVQSDKIQSRSNLVPMINLRSRCKEWIPKIDRKSCRASGIGWHYRRVTQISRGPVHGTNSKWKVLLHSFAIDWETWNKVLFLSHKQYGSQENVSGEIILSVPFKGNNRIYLNKKRLSFLYYCWLKAKRYRLFPLGVSQWSRI